MLQLKIKNIVKNYFQRAVNKSLNYWGALAQQLYYLGVSRQVYEVKGFSRLETPHKIRIEN